MSVGIYGARRSGKSTLLRLAAGIALPDSGTIRFEGRDIATMSVSERGRLLRSEIAFMSSEDWRANPGEIGRRPRRHIAGQRGPDDARGTWAGAARAGQRRRRRRRGRRADRVAVADRAHPRDARARPRSRTTAAGARRTGADASASAIATSFYALLRDRPRASATWRCWSPRRRWSALQGVERADVDRRRRTRLHRGARQRRAASRAPPVRGGELQTSERARAA